MIEIKHLSKTFQMKDGAVEALQDIDLTIPDGMIYGIIGMSGGGQKHPGALHQPAGAAHPGFGGDRRHRDGIPDPLPSCASAARRSP